MKTLLIALAALTALALPAEAHQRRHYGTHCAVAVLCWPGSHRTSRVRYSRHHAHMYRRHPERTYGDGRPRAWCGWYARHALVSSDPGPAYNLARNWAHWGNATGPRVGAMVVWPHHVGMITGQDASGRWIIKSGNDGHTVRERARSIAGAIAFRA